MNCVSSPWKGMLKEISTGGRHSGRECSARTLPRGTWLRAAVLLTVLAAFFLVPVPALAAAPHMVMNTGSYTGDGADNRQITGIGFEPDVVIIKGDTAQAAVVRTSTMTAGNSKNLESGGNYSTNRIKSFESDGFTIGTEATVNSNGITYYWVAFKAAAGEMKVGSYSGTGAAHDETGVGFQPGYVVVMSTSSYSANHATSSLSGKSWSFTGSGYTDGITGMVADGFSLGTNSRVNRSGDTYYYIAWKAVSGWLAVGSYTADNTDDRSIGGVGFKPEWVIVQRTATDQARHKPASTGASTDASQLFDVVADETNRIQALESDGFQVGNGVGVNISSTYYYMAFNMIWQSYQETEHTDVWGTVTNPYTSTDYTAYMYGDGYTAGHSFRVGFYDATVAGGGNKVASVDGTLSGTALSALLDLRSYGDRTAGTWHAVVFDVTLGGSPPNTYNECSGATGYVGEDDFEVSTSAIPEFTTTLASVITAGLCFGIYWWLRKRNLAHVKA